MSTKHPKLEEQAAEVESKMQKEQTSGAHLEALLNELRANKTERGAVITLENVLFGTDLAPLNPSGMRIVQKLAYVLQKNLKYIVLVEGFTDNTGSTSHNQDLSEHRATSVRNDLLELGVARERITIRG